jgi:hypothetical protein
MAVRGLFLKATITAAAAAAAAVLSADSDGNSSVSVSDSTFSSNNAAQGGGLAGSAHTWHISSCSIINHSVPGR